MAVREQLVGVDSLLPQMVGIKLRSKDLAVSTFNKLNQHTGPSLLHTSLKPCLLLLPLGPCTLTHPCKNSCLPRFPLIIFHTAPPQSFLAPKSSSENPYSLWSGCFLLSGLPFLFESIRRNFGHCTSTVRAGAEEGQQLMLSQSPSQPADKIGVQWSMDQGHPPPFNPSSHYTLTP